jgi:hypothetical protein
LAHDLLTGLLHDCRFSCLLVDIPTLPLDEVFHGGRMTSSHKGDVSHGLGLEGKETRFLLPTLMETLDDVVVVLHDCLLLLLLLAVLL